MTLFNDLGFRWDRALVSTDIPIHTVRRACFRFHRMLPEIVWDASVLEGNSFTFPEVKTLTDGVTIGGRNVSDHQQIMNLIYAARHLLAQVQGGGFSACKATFCNLHRIVARKGPVEEGIFRDEGRDAIHALAAASCDQASSSPLPIVAGAPELNRVFTAGVHALNEQVPNAFERGCAFFLFGALQQFFFDGNKRTSRFMMNGVLMSHGIDAISVPAQRAAEFNEKMVRFYLSKDATEMMAFLFDCHPK